MKKHLLKSNRKLKIINSLKRNRHTLTITRHQPRQTKNKQSNKQRNKSRNHHIILISLTRLIKIIIEIMIEIKKTGKNGKIIQSTGENNKQSNNKRDSNIGRDIKHMRSSDKSSM